MSLLHKRHILEFFLKLIKRGNDALGHRLRRPARNLDVLIHRLVMSLHPHLGSFEIRHQPFPALPDFLEGFRFLLIQTRFQGIQLLERFRHLLPLRLVAFDYGLGNILNGFSRRFRKDTLHMVCQKIGICFKGFPVVFGKFFRRFP